MRRFHVGLGVGLIMVYAFVLFHRSDVLPGLVAKGMPSIVGRAARGYWVIYGLPIAAIVRFLFPQRLTWWLSPRPPPLYEYLITDGVWYLLGYCLLAVGVGVLLLFR
jgi:hypothetical protein